ncbi:hypothetical protein D9M68_720540 [compost metagenome]
MLAEPRTVADQVRNTGITGIGAHAGIGIRQARLKRAVGLGNADLAPLHGIHGRRVRRHPRDEGSSLPLDVFDETRPRLFGDQDGRSRHVHVADRQQPLGAKALAQRHQDLHGLLHCRAFLSRQHSRFFFRKKHVHTSIASGTHGTNSECCVKSKKAINWNRIRCLKTMFFR